MKKFVLTAVAAVAFASPAMANEARVEVRGGVIFGQGETEDAYGVAAGYDVDLGKQGFVGIEVGADKVAADNTDVIFSVGGRVGYKADTGTRLFTTAGYTSPRCDGCIDAIHAGAGVEQNISSNTYGKLEYRHYFIGEDTQDVDAIVVGVGMRF